MAITKVTSGLISADASSIDLNIDAGTLYLDVSENRVGIGTTSPSRPLHIAKSSGTTILELQRTNTNTTGTTGAIQFNASDDHAIAAIAVVGDGDNEGGEITFRTTSAASENNYFNSTTERLRISSAGSVFVEQGKSIGWRYQVSGTHRGSISCDSADNITFANGSGASERMRIDGSGRVGIGTTSPSFPLQVDKGATGDIAHFEGQGSVHLRIGEASNVMYLDALNGSASIAFRSNNSEKMRIDSSGSLLVGTTSQTFGEKLKVTTSGSGKNTAFFEFTSSDDRAVIISKHGFSTGATSRTHLAILNDANTQVGSIAATGVATTFNTSSDGRLKDVTGEARGLEVINELNPVAYNWKESGQADEGLIAQEVMEIVPNAVTGSEEKYYQMDYSKLVVHLVAGMKEQQTIIDNLTTRIETLENA